MRSRWALLAILCVLASTAVGAETCVWASDFADGVGVGVDHSLTLELHRGCELGQDPSLKRAKY